jgi:hypothetical protein
MESDLSPRGVPLHEVERILRAAHLDVAREGDALVLRQENPLHGEALMTRIAVMPPEIAEAEAAGMTAVIRVFTLLPASHARRYDSEMVCFANRFAALGAFTVTEGVSFIGSRITIHGDNEEWHLARPLVAAAAAGAADAVVGGMQRFLNNERPPAAVSAWTEQDFQAVAAALGANCACTCEAGGMTAQFRLSGAAGVHSAAAAHSNAGNNANAANTNSGNNIAYWELLAAPPHIELGGGLVCVLQLPQRYAQAQSRHAAVNLLNISEMNSPGLPPHIGAWCEGKAGDNFAYVSFLPNVLHAVPGLAIEVSRWARRRAEAVVNLLDAAEAAAANHAAT